MASRVRSAPRGHLLAAQLVERDLGRVDHHVDPGQLPELAQLLGGEGGLGRPAAAEHHDLADAAGPELGQGVVGDVGPGQHLGGAGQDARQVHGHVAVAHHHRPRGGQAEGQAAVVGVGVVPAHELGGRVAPRQVLAGHAQAPVGARAHRVDDGVVVGRQVGVGHVAAELHVAVEAELRVGGDLVVDPGHRLDLLVVRGHPAAHQAEGRGQPVVHVHLDHERLALQALGGVEARRPRADDGHPQRLLGRADLPAHVPLLPPPDRPDRGTLAAEEVVGRIAQQLAHPAGRGLACSRRRPPPRAGRRPWPAAPRRRRPARRPGPRPWPPGAGPRGRARRGGPPARESRPPRWPR